MNKENDFFALLRNALWGEPAILSDHPDWRGIMEIANKQAVNGLVANAILSLPEDKRPSTEFCDRLFGMVSMILRSHLILDSEAARMVDFYNSHSLPTVILKGHGVARNYPNPKLRTCGDVDLYVGRKNYKRAFEISKQTFAASDSEAMDGPKHFHFHNGSVVIELHRVAAMMAMPLYRNRFQKWMDSELDNPGRLRSVMINDVEVKLPSVQFDAIFIFYHAWHHFVYAGIGLRQLCDWAMVLHRYAKEIDKKELSRTLKKIGLVKPWQLVGYILVDKLGLPAEEMPLYDPGVAKRSLYILSLIMEGGNFGLHSRFFIFNSPHVPIFHRKWRTFKRAFYSYRSMMKVLPGYATFYFLAETFGGLYRFLKELIRERKKCK